MADEKKLKTEEITDEQANAAAGGFGTNRYQCEGGCGKSYWGEIKYRVDGRPYCYNCYSKYQQSQLSQQFSSHERWDPDERPVSHEGPIFKI